ncbi:MAG: caspase family protein [bacterium]
MYKKIVLLFLFIGVISVYAQHARGKSEAGKITNLFKKTSDIKAKTELICEVSYQDPSGDNFLTEGETGKVTILVKNTGNYTVRNPKLEIEYKTSWEAQPENIVKFLDSIEPGGTGKYINNIKWDARLPSGTITYTAKAVDRSSGFESESAEIAFNITTKGTESVEPVFVDVDKNIPRVGTSNRYGIAVVIGNENYTHKDVPDVEYAHNDAITIKKYLKNMLGYKEDNIIFIDNASKSDFERVFGTESVPEGKLYNWVRANRSDVFVYYSGHGAPDMKNKKAYFMPSNSDPNYVRIDGYPLEVFYKNLNKIQAKSITVVLDACFSGGSQKGMILQKASPMYIDVDFPFYGNKINVITSASGAQISSWYPEANHSLFTYYFLRGLRGEADKNKDRNITLKEVHRYVNDNVPYMARRIYGREQTPTMNGIAEYILCSF